MNDNAFKLALHIVQGIGEPPEGYSWRVPPDHDEWILVKYLSPPSRTDTLVWMQLDSRGVLLFSYKMCYGQNGMSDGIEVHTVEDADRCIGHFFFTRHIWSS
jgi:hypothetical protein